LNANVCVSPLPVFGVTESTVGGELLITVSDAFAVFPVPPFADVTLTLLLIVPADALVTFTENVHEVLGASDAPESEAAAAPTAAVIVPPPHEPVSPFGLATTNPDGNESVKPTPVNVTLLLLF
jgi:hypothetical protein